MTMVQKEIIEIIRNEIKRGKINIFNSDFRLTLYELLSSTVDPEKKHGDFLVDIVSSLLQKPGYEHVLKCYVSGDPLTTNYSPLCKQALDLYRERLNQQP